MEIKQKVPFTVKQLSLETPQVIKENEEVDFHIHHNKIQWFWNRISFHKRNEGGSVAFVCSIIALIMWCISGFLYLPISRMGSRMEGAGLMGIYGALGILAISSAITMIWCIGFILSFIATISFIISLIKGKQIPLGKRIFIIVSSIMIPITIVLLIRTL